MKWHLPLLTFALVICLSGPAAAGDLSTEEALGAFPGCYSINTGLAGGPTLHLSLIFSTSDHSLTGHAQVTQALADPVVVRSKVYGSYLRLQILGAPYYLVNGDGYPDIHWPPHGGIGPVLLPNLDFHFNTATSFNFGGKSHDLEGTGRFRYRSEFAGPWSSWFDGKVVRLDCAADH